MSAVLDDVEVATPAKVDPYHARPLDPSVASKTGLDRIARSPAHYWHYCHEESPETAALLFGRAMHAYMLEPDVFSRRFVVAPDFGDLRTKIGKAAKAEFLEHVLRDREMVKADDFDLIRRMTDSVMAHPTARNLIVGGEAEQRIDWIDPETGLRCKARADYRLRELRMCVDVKSTDNASPSTFARSVATYRYHVQDAFYRSGFAAIGEPIDYFVFLAVEKEPPYLASVCYVDDAALERGAELMLRDLATLKRCVETNEWPGYPIDLTPIALPAWAFFD